MKMAQKSRKPSFSGIVVDATRAHYQMAQGKKVKPVKTPGLRGGRTYGSMKTK